MEVKDARDIYYDRSGTASDVARQLGYAGIAIIWIFRVETQSEVTQVALSLPRSLWLGAILIVTALSFDLFQYVWASAAWGAFARMQEVKGATNFKAPARINWPSITFFWLKLASIALAYVVIFAYLVRALS